MLFALKMHTGGHKMHEVIIQVCFVMAGLVNACTTGVVYTDHPTLVEEVAPVVYVENAPRQVISHYSLFSVPIPVIQYRRSYNTRGIYIHPRHQRRHVHRQYRHHHKAHKKSVYHKHPRHKHKVKHKHTGKSTYKSTYKKTHKKAYKPKHKHKVKRRRGTLKSKHRGGRHKKRRK